MWVINFPLISHSTKFGFNFEQKYCIYDRTSSRLALYRSNSLDEFQHRWLGPVFDSRPTCMVLTWTKWSSPTYGLATYIYSGRLLSDDLVPNLLFGAMVHYLILEEKMHAPTHHYIYECTNVRDTSVQRDWGLGWIIFFFTVLVFEQY